MEASFRGSNSAKGRVERTTARGSGKDSIDHPRDMHDDVANCVTGAAVLAASGAGYNLDLLARATAWDDAPAEPSYFQLQSERRHAALMQRYFQPVSLNSLHEFEAKADLPEHVTDALQRARLDALRRQDGGST